jgi:hypothetical protein
LKRGIGLTVILIILSTACLFEVNSVKAQSITGTTDSSWRNWVNVDVVYLGSDSITLKLTFQLIGNTLHNNTDIVITSIKSGASWIAIIGGVTMQAWYSSDINMTTYVYTLSSELVDIKQTGNFPYDSWQINANVTTQNPILFDDDHQISSTSSGNYFCEYYMTDSSNPSLNHSLSITIQHPSSFVNFVHITYLFPFTGLLLLLVFLCDLAWKNRGSLEKVRDSLLLVSIGSVVFIPVYELPLANLKMPFLIDNYDLLFAGLFIAYFVFIAAVLEFNQPKKLKSESNTIKTTLEKKQKTFFLTMTRDEGLLIVGVAIGFLAQVMYDVSHEFTLFVFKGTPTELFWLITQAALTVIFALLALTVLRKMPKK